jgi:hypothetical protein
MDPVCVMHGKRMSEHVCLYCCICFADLTPEQCASDEHGNKFDVCEGNCARQAGLSTI